MTALVEAEERMKRRVLVAVAVALPLAYQPTTQTTPAAVATAATSISVQASGVIAATGAGRYLLQEAFDVQFSFAAIQLDNARAFGSFRHRTEDETGTIDFTGEVTCLAVDSVNRRAWIGGVITANRSTSPNFNTAAVHQVGHDIWFRVLDTGHGNAEADRSTFVGFEGVIPTSEAYCRDRIWPEGNARTWPVISGNLVVHP
jgi:hypothetical protein